MKNNQNVLFSQEKKGKGREKPPPQGLNLRMGDKNSRTTGVEWGQCFQESLNMDGSVPCQCFSVMSAFITITQMGVSGNRV